MPKAGFKSITVTDEVYDHFKASYIKKRPRLTEKGINSFSGYLTAILYQFENEM